MLMNAYDLLLFLPTRILFLPLLITTTVVVSHSQTNNLSITSTTDKIESVIINGTHIEVTTVKIAEISNRAIKAITAKHFTTKTPMPKVILIPPANHTSQIKRHHKNT